MSELVGRPLAGRLLGARQRADLRSVQRSARERAELRLMLRGAPALPADEFTKSWANFSS